MGAGSRNGRGGNGDLPARVDPAGQVAGALGRLDSVSRALLDLSLRQRVTDERLAAIGRTDVETLRARRSAALRAVTRGMGLTPDQQCEHVRRALEELAGERPVPVAPVASGGRQRRRRAVMLGVLAAAGLLRPRGRKF